MMYEISDLIYERKMIDNRNLCLIYVKDKL